TSDSVKNSDSVAFGARAVAATANDAEPLAMTSVRIRSARTRRDAIGGNATRPARHGYAGRDVHRSTGRRSFAVATGRVTGGTASLRALRRAPALRRRRVDARPVRRALPVYRVWTRDVPVVRAGLCELIGSAA